MTPNEYVESILAKYEVPYGSTSPAERLGSVVAGPLRNWAGQQLNALEYSGSCAKGTAVHGTSDVDVFISLKSDTTNTLKELYYAVYALAQQQRWSPRHQNCSVGVTLNGTRGDLVIGKVQAGYQNYHSLYLRKQDSWRQTNVALHINTVRNSGRQREIRAVKIWRMLHGLELPSLYLELFVIESLSRRSQVSLAENVIHVLNTMGTSFATTRIVDPSNTNNVLSDDLTMQEKNTIAAVAAQSARQQTWGGIIW